MAKKKKKEEPIHIAVPPKKETPAQIAGREYIKAREKRTAELIPAGSTETKGAREQASREVSAKMFAPEAQAKEEALLKAQTAEAIQKEKAQLFAPEISDLFALPQTKTPKGVFEEAIKAKPMEEERGVALQLAVQTLDTLRVAITGKKPIKVQVAEQSLNEAMAQIGKDIDEVKLGRKPARDAVANFRLAEQALNRLEASQKGLGQLNARYWADAGKDVETTIFTSKTHLEDLRRELAEVSVLSRRL